MMIFGNIFKTKYLSLLLCLCFIEFKPAIAKEFTFGKATTVSSTDCAVNVLNRAYGELGVKVNYQIMPSKRSFAEANSGNIDGELARVSGIEDKYPNLIRIPVTICLAPVYLFSTKPIVINSFYDLSKLKLGIRTGIEHSERNFKRLSPHYATSNKQLLTMLLNSRIDIAVMSYSAFAKIKDSYPEHKFFRLTFDIPPAELFHYLHKKHVNFIPSIHTKLNELKQNGFIEQMNQAQQQALMAQ